MFLELLLLSTFLRWSEGAPAVAHTGFGDIIGVSLRNGVDQYLGIPFAHAPRFHNPIQWSSQYELGQFLALKPGAQCPQPSGATSEFVEYSEDCLSLNIWTPSNTQHVKLPIQIFIHGGNWQSGSGDGYNASRIVEKHSSVVVTMNYRLGAFGWLHLNDAQANLGLKDQRAAMRWVQQNIAAFHADPNRVMLFGESVGAIAVSTHLVSPASSGLFSAAIMESGSPTSVSRFQAEGVRAEFLKAAGCDMNSTKDVMVCLQQAKLSVLEAASLAAVPAGIYPGMRDPFDKPTWGVTVDSSDEGLPATPMSLLKHGAFTNASLLAGTNTDEGTLFVYTWYTKAMDATTFRKFTGSLIRNRLQPGTTVNMSTLDALLTFYSPDTHNGVDNRPLAARMTADMIFACGTRALAKAFVKTNASLYRFDYRAKQDPSPLDWGVSHGSEVPFVFDQPSWVNGDSSTFSHAEEEFASALGAMWRQFAFAGRVGPLPHGAEFLLTPLEGQPSALPFPTVEVPQLASCDFWESLEDPSLRYVV